LCLFPLEKDTKTTINRLLTEFDRKKTHVFVCLLPILCAQRNKLLGVLEILYMYNLLCRYCQ
jgi:hypothetical protein